MNRAAVSVILAVMLTVVATNGVAQVVENPSWTQPPDQSLTRSLTPGFADWMGIDGSAVIACVVRVDGHQFECRVESEAPVGLGFGEAARLVIASGELRGKRLDGRQVAALVRTTVRFQSNPIEGRDRPLEGSEPTAAQLGLARQVVEQADINLPEGQETLDGLDFDRRSVVEPWMAELFPPNLERFRTNRAIQAARVFSEEELHRLLNRQPVEWPSDEELSAAIPAWTQQSLDAIRELRRRYCDRYGCEAAEDAGR